MARDFEKDSTQFLSNTSPPVTDEPMSFAAWVNPESIAAPNGNTVISVGDTDGFEGFVLALDDSNGVMATVYDNAIAYSASYAVTLSTGVWAHVGAVFGGASSRYAYYNGDASSEGTDTVSTTGMDNIIIGVLALVSSTLFPFDGLIAEVGVWNAALTEAEMTVLAEGVSPLAVRPGNLVFYAPLLGNNSPEPDIVGGLSMTLTGPPAKAAHPRVLMPGRGFSLGVPVAAAGVVIPVMFHHHARQWRKR